MGHLPFLGVGILPVVSHQFSIFSKFSIFQRECQWNGAHGRLDGVDSFWNHRFLIVDTFELPLLLSPLVGVPYLHDTIVLRVAQAVHQVKTVILIFF